LFYDNQLIPQGNRMLTDSCIEWEELPKKRFPILFHSVTGRDTREGKNPSFFNPEEANIVVDYLQKLLDNKQRGMQKVVDCFSS
jgi:helicase MOV-10